MFSLRVTNVAPARVFAAFVNCAKSCFVLYHSLLWHTVCSLCGSAIKCIPKPPIRWSNAKMCAQQPNEYFHMKLISQIQDSLN